MKRIRARVLVRIGLCVAVSMLVVGCGESGPDMGKVTGTVTLDGAPLENAELEFQPQAEGGSPSYGVTDAEGKYVMKFSITREGAYVGKHTVRITGADRQYEIGPAFTLPAKYNRNSELTENVEKGKNEINFALTSE